MRYPYKVHIHRHRIGTFHSFDGQIYKYHDPMNTQAAGSATGTDQVANSVPLWNQ